MGEERLEQGERPRQLGLRALALERRGLLEHRQQIGHGADQAARLGATRDLRLEPETLLALAAAAHEHQSPVLTAGAAPALIAGPAEPIGDALGEALARGLLDQRRLGQRAGKRRGFDQSGRQPSLQRMDQAARPGVPC